MAANLIVQDQLGNLIVDTRNVVYGLVKSGNMQLINYWTRRAFKGGNVDPAIGANWTESTMVANPSNNTDATHGFTIYNSRSPIVFITGGGSLITSSVGSDGGRTYFYTGASTNSKFYCYDLMADNIPGTTFLKTWNDQGIITFNSLQVPLNVATSAQAPPLGNGDATQTTQPYAGGGGAVIFPPTQRQLTYRYYVDVATPGLGEVAAYLPWSRGCTVTTSGQNFGSPTGWRQSCTEGCFGATNKVTFSFAETAGAPFSNAALIGLDITSFQGVSPNPRPTALIIRTAGLPFPFN